jgi:hypothetical protein
MRLRQHTWWGLAPAWVPVLALVLALTAGCSAKPVVEESKDRWVRISHTPLEETKAGRPTTIQADITGGPPGSEITAFVFYRSGKGPFQTSDMRILEPGRYFGSIPARLRGEKIEYYIEARTGSDIVARVPAKLKAEGFPLAVKGTPNRYLLITHITVIFVALFFFLFSGYLSYRALQHRRSLLYIPRVAFLGTVAFFIASIPLGMAVAYQTYGKPWTGFPVGRDLTDNKALVILIWWAVCAVLYRGSLWRKDPSHDLLPMVTLPYAHLAGAALTLILYLLPH